MDSSSSGGLRRRPAADSNAETNKSSTSNNDVNDNFNDGTDEDNIEETSDKETRLTLMEEVLLLGLKDKEVSWLFHIQ
jgi:golgi phosphoprotein 3